MAEPIGVLVVEDHHVVRQGLVALLSLEEGIAVVGEAADGLEAVVRYRQCSPDVVLIDLRLPKLSGAEVIQRVRSESPGANFIVLTTYDGDEDIYRTLTAGARAYLLKGMTGAELIAAIRAVHAGESLIPSSVAEKLARRLGAQGLTPREADVLARIARGYNNRRIATELDVSITTVKTHVNNLMNKLGATDRTHAATIAIQRGIVTLESLRQSQSQ